MKRKLSLSTAVLGLLAYAGIFFWQVDSATRRAGDAFLERQLWLARQSALYLERHLGDNLSLEQAVAGLHLEGGGPGESRLALLDRSGTLLHAAQDSALPEQAATALAPRLTRGGHGSARLPLDGRAWLLTYLPLAGGERPLTLILAAPEAEVVAPVKQLARGQLLMHLALLALAAWAVYGLRKRGGGAASAVASAAAASELEELRDQCRVLAQENALLGAVRREYQLLVEGAEQGLARLNSNGLLLFCSKPLLHLLGRERKDLLGRNLLDLDLLVAGREELQQALGRVREAEAAQPVLCTLAGRGAGVKQLELRLSPLRVDGEVTGILLQAQEVVAAAPYLRMSNS